MIRTVTTLRDRQTRRRIADHRLSRQEPGKVRMPAIMRHCPVMWRPTRLRKWPLLKPPLSHPMSRRRILMMAVTVRIPTLKIFPATHTGAADRGGTQGVIRDKPMMSARNRKGGPGGFCRIMTLGLQAFWGG